MRSLARPGMKVDAIRAEAEEGADPAGDVVDREFADAVDAADPVVNGSMQLMEGAAGRNGLAGQRVRSVLKGVAGDAALMGMPLPGREHGQSGGADGGIQAVVAGPAIAFVFGSRAIVTAVGADDCLQGMQTSRRGISAWRTRQRRAGRSAGRTRHQWRQMGTPEVDIKGVAPSDGLDGQLPWEPELHAGWAPAQRRVRSLRVSIAGPVTHQAPGREAVGARSPRTSASATAAP